MLEREEERVGGRKRRKMGEDKEENIRGGRRW